MQNKGLTNKERIELLDKMRNDLINGKSKPKIKSTTYPVENLSFNDWAIHIKKSIMQMTISYYGKCE